MMYETPINRITRLLEQLECSIMFDNPSEERRATLYARMDKLDDISIQMFGSRIITD